MVDRVNEDTRNATAAQEGQEASTTETLDSGSQPLSESVAQLAQNEPENTGENQQETGQETPDDPQELISQALAVLAEQGFDVEDGIDLEDPAVVAALQDAGFSIDQLVLAVAEVTGEQIEPAAGPEAGPAGAADGGGDRFAPTDPGSIDDGIGISGLLDPRGLEPSPLLADPTGFGDGLDLSISVSVQTDLDGVAGLGLFEDWQPIQAESQDPGGSSGFTDSDTNFDTQMYQDLRDTAGDLSYTPFDSLGNPGEDFLFPGNLVFDIDAEPDTVPVDYGPLEISGAPAGSYLFYVDGDNTIQRFDFVDGTETFTLSDVSEAYLEGNNIFILPPEDSDVDFTLDVSLDVEALGDTITFTGDVPVVLDAVADLPDVDARGGETGIFIDADDVNGDVEVDADGAFIFTEDNSQNSFFDELPPINPPVEEPQPSGLENSDYREFEQGDRGLQDGPREGICCYKGTVYNEQPIYNLPFATSVTDRDRAFDRDPSEGLTEIRIALGENTEKNNTEVAAELPPFGRGGFHASIGEQLLNADTLLDDEDNPLEVQVTLPASYWSEETGFVSQGDGGEILITVTLDPDTLDQDTGELVFNDFQVLGEDGETPIEGVRIQDIDFGDFSVHLPRHADNDLNVSVSSTVEELRASVGTDGEITTENNTATNTQDYEVNFLAVADGTQIIVTDYSEIIGEGGGLCDFTPPQDSPNTSRDDYGKLEGDEWGGTYTAIFAEDGEESRDQHGYDNDAGEPRDESRLEIPLHFTATQIDQDGSESVTKFTIDLYGTDSSDPLPAGTEITYPANSDDGVVIARFNEDGELELEDVDLSSITFNTTEGTEVTGSLSIEGGKLVVDLDENSEAAGEGIVLDGEIGVRLPIDSSKDFSAEFEVTTAETDATGAVLPGLECNTTKSTIDFDVKGVAGPAEVGFTSYEDEACRPIYGEGSESVPSDLTSASESGPNGVSLHGFGFGVAFMANGALDLSDEASGSVIFDGNGAGVRVGNDNGENRGGQVPDQIGHDPDGDGGSSEALVAELDDPASSVTVTVSNLYNTEDQGEYGQVTLFNSQGEVLGKVLFGSAPEEDFADYEGVYQQVDFDGGTNVGTIDLKASDFCEGEAIGSLAFEAVPYGGAETGGIETGDSSDYFVREIDYTKASIEGWTFPEDGAELSSAHGAEGDGENLVIPVKLVAATQDNDGSEGITRMTLRNRGEGQEARVWQVKDAEAEGNIVESPSEWVLINVPGKDGGEGGQGLARLADDGDLVLNFGRNALKVAETQENDAWIDIFEQAPGPESVDLSGVVSLKLPIDDSNDFEVNATTQTTEYDDDAFSNLDDRILEENWREICEGDCGDKTADQFVSQQFNVSGVVAEAEVGFASYSEEACRPIYGEGSDSESDFVEVDLRDDAPSSGVSLHGFGFSTGAAFIVDGALNLDAASADSLVFDENGAGVLVGEYNGENRGGQVPDQIGHDPDGDGGSSEALVAELDDPASSVTVTVSNLYNTEDQGEYGQVTLFNSQGEVLGKVLFGSAPEEDFADYEGVYQQVDFDGGTNVGTIDLKASDFCEGEAIGSLAFEAVPYGGAETGGIETGDSSDYFVREIDYTKASIEGWTFPEDGAELSSAHGAEGDGENLVIPVKLVAATQDNDGSEGITRMTLRNRGEGQEARVWQVKDAEAEGNIVESPSEWVLINVPGKDGGEGGQGLARLADDGDLVLNFGRNALKVAETQENDAWIDIFEQAPGPESVDLSGVVSLKLPIDDSNDFEVNATTQTTEYDDDAFSNLDDRILEENWREICEGDCGDKTADQFVSQQFNVSGVVAEAETDFGDYNSVDGFCGEQETGFHGTGTGPIFEGINFKWANPPYELVDGSSEGAPREINRSDLEERDGVGRISIFGHEKYNDTRPIDNKDEYSIHLNKGEKLEISGNGGEVDSGGFLSDIWAIVRENFPNLGDISQQEVYEAFTENLSDIEVEVIGPNGPLTRSDDGSGNYTFDIENSGEHTVQISGDGGLVLYGGELTVHPADYKTYVFSEDQGDQQTNDPLVLPVKYSAETQDDDGSEGITKVTLNIGSALATAGATWMQGNQTLADEGTIWLLDKNGEKVAADVSIDGGELTLDIPAPGLEELQLDPDQALVNQNSDLTGSDPSDFGLQIKLPDDYSGEFVLDIETTTIEFDDDAFSDLSERQLKDNWEEICGDCGDKTETVSNKIGFKISGDVDPAIVTTGESNDVEDDVDDDCQTRDDGPLSVPVHFTTSLQDNDGTESITGIKLTPPTIPGGSFVFRQPDGTYDSYTDGQPLIVDATGKVDTGDAVIEKPVWLKVDQDGDDFIFTPVNEDGSEIDGQSGIKEIVFSEGSSPVKFQLPQDFEGEVTFEGKVQATEYGPIYEGSEDCEPKRTDDWADLNLQTLTEVTVDGRNDKPLAADDLDDVNTVCAITDVEIKTAFDSSNDPDIPKADDIISFKSFDVEELSERGDLSDDVIGGWDVEGNDLTFKVTKSPEFGALYKWDGTTLEELDAGGTFTSDHAIFWAATQEDADTTSYGLSNDDDNTSLSDWTDSFENDEGNILLEAFRQDGDNWESAALDFKYDGSVGDGYGGIGVESEPGRDEEVDWKDGKAEKLVFTPGQKVLGATVQLGLLFGGDEAGGHYEANPGIDAEKMKWTAYSGGDEVASGIEYGSEDGLRSFDVSVPFDKLVLEPQDNEESGGNLSDFVLRSIETREIPGSTDFEYGVYDDPDCLNCIDTAKVDIDVDASAPPQADHVNSTAVSLDQYLDDHSGGALEGAFDDGSGLDLDESDYAYVREFSIDGFIGNDQDSTFNDTSLGGADLETSLENLEFRITEAPTEGILVIKDGTTGNYRVIDNAPLDESNSTFSSDDRIWWLGNEASDGSGSNSATVNLASIGNGPLHTTETQITDPALGEVTFTSYIQVGSDFVEGGSLFNTGNGLGVKQTGAGAPSNNQIDEPERLGVKFEEAVKSATFTAKPYNGEPDGKVAYTIFDENGTELKSDEVDVDDLDGSTATFTVDPGEDFHSIQIGPAGRDDSDDAGANFSIQSVEVTRNEGGLLQDTFKYEVVDECEKTSDEATVTIGAEGDDPPIDDGDEDSGDGGDDTPPEVTVSSATAALPTKNGSAKSVTGDTWDPTVTVTDDRPNLTGATMTISGLVAGMMTVSIDNPDGLSSDFYEIVTHDDGNVNEPDGSGTWEISLTEERSVSEYQNFLDSIKINISDFDTSDSDSWIDGDDIQINLSVTDSDSLTGLGDGSLDFVDGGNWNEGNNNSIDITESTGSAANTQGASMFAMASIPDANDGELIEGTSSGDELVGGFGDDTLKGYGGDDLLSGGPGNDTLEGGKGDDVLIGGAGKNTLDGGDGEDTFVFDDEALADLLTNSGNTDTVKDFNTNDDAIDLSDLSDILWDQDDLSSNVNFKDDNGDTVMTVRVKGEDGEDHEVEVARFDNNVDADDMNNDAEVRIKESDGEVYSGNVSDAQVYVEDQHKPDES